MCDALQNCLPKEYAPTRVIAANWCRAHTNQRPAAVYSVRHSRKHIEVFLGCKENAETKNAIVGLLPVGVTLKARPLPRKGNWAKSTPFFLQLDSEEQAQSMGRLFKFLCDSWPNSSGSARTTARAYWHPPSESEDAMTSAEEEGSKILVLVNKYERKRKNRNICIKSHGALCSVCAFDFSVTYGEMGNGYIHVHHLTPLNALGGRPVKIDPVKDLRPVCSNCHEMLHQCDPPHTIEQLRAIMSAAKAAADRNSPPR
jgi:hypothetical protein